MCYYYIVETDVTRKISLSFWHLFNAMELAENIQKIKECIWTADLCRSTNCQKVQNFINDCQLKCFSQIEMIQMSHLNVSYDTSLPPSLIFKIFKRIVWSNALWPDLRFLEFGQLFKAFGNNYFGLILHILRQFL